MLWLSFLLVSLCWLAVVYFFYRHRIWLPFYVVGAVGLTLLIIWAGRWLIPLEMTLERYTAYNVHDLANWFGVETHIFQEAPGAILVLVIPQELGWVLLEVGIECSGLLEEAVLVGLLAFYPGWPLYRRLALLSFGLMATYAGNLIRVLFIVFTLHYMGKDAVFLAHTLVGRVIFFCIVVLIYWLVLTWPTLDLVRANLLHRQSR